MNKLYFIFVFKFRACTGIIHNYQNQCFLITQESRVDCLLNLLLITVFWVFSAVYANDIHNVTSVIDVGERRKTINWSLGRIDSPKAVCFKSIPRNKMKLRASSQSWSCHMKKEIVENKLNSFNYGYTILK